MTSVLVAYATSHGSTAEVAERIAQCLRVRPLIVDCLAVDKVETHSLPNYSAIVLGSAIHAQTWLGPAKHFLHQHRNVLKTKPVWAFTVAMPPSEIAHVKEEAMMTEKLKKDLPNLKEHRLFDGRFEKSDLGWWLRWVTYLVPSSATKWGDARDWEKIADWADKVGYDIEGLSKT